jgi:hypothetical protein
MRPEGLGQYKNPPHQDLNPRLSGLQHSALTTTPTACTYKILLAARSRILRSPQPACPGGGKTRLIFADVLIKYKIVVENGKTRMNVRNAVNLWSN